VIGASADVACWRVNAVGQMQIHSIRQELIRDRRDSVRGGRRPRSTASSQRTTGSICCASAAGVSPICGAAAIGGSGR
jgi:hypothetical protein